MARTGSSETEIRSLIADLSKALHDKDAKRVLSHYAPGSVVFDLAPPLQHEGSGAASEKELKEACDQALYHGKQNGRNVAVVCTGRGSFRVIERSGDPGREIKRRMGLAGDNSPLEPQAAETADSGVVDCVVQAAGTLERLHANASGKQPAVAEPAPKPRRKYTRRKLKPVAVDQNATAAEAPAKPPKPRRRKAPRRKPELTEEQKLAAESDRLDYLTEEEAAQLAAGAAPSKRLRNAETNTPAQ